MPKSKKAFSKNVAIEKKGKDPKSAVAIAKKKKK